MSSRPVQYNEHSHHTYHTGAPLRQFQEGGSKHLSVSRSTQMEVSRGCDTYGVEWVEVGIPDTRDMATRPVEVRYTLNAVIVVAEEAAGNRKNRAPGTGRARLSEERHPPHCM